MWMKPQWTQTFINYFLIPVHSGDWVEPVTLTKVLGNLLAFDNMYCLTDTARFKVTIDVS